MYFTTPENGTVYIHDEVIYLSRYLECSRQGFVSKSRGRSRQSRPGEGIGLICEMGNNTTSVF